MRGALISRLETLEPRRMLTNTVAVSVTGGSVNLQDISGNSATGDDYTVSYTSTQFVLTGLNGTSFQVGSQVLTTYTATVSGALSLSMSLNNSANTVTVTGDGTAVLNSLNIGLGSGVQSNSLTLTKVLADSVSINGGGNNNDVVLNSCTISGNLGVNIGTSSGDILDMEMSTVSGNVTDSVGTLTMNQTTVSGMMNDSQLGANSVFNSTDTTIVGDFNVNMGQYSVINFLFSSLGRTTTDGNVKIDGVRHKDIDIFIGESSPDGTLISTVNYGIYPTFTHATMILVNNATTTAPTVNNVIASTTTPTITGTYTTSTEHSPVLTVAVNGTTYTLGKSPQLTSPSAGNWSLDLAAVGSTPAAPLPTNASGDGTFTVTATTTDQFGNALTGTGTITNQQFSIATYATANNLTTVPLANGDGVSYAVTTAGTGATPVAGETVVATYKAFVLNADGTLGTEVDANSTGASFQLPTGGMTTGNQVGLYAALLDLKVGSSDTVFVPSALAYGTAGGTGSVAAIPANSILVYELMIVSANTATTPTVNNVPLATTTPTITGTYDATNSTTFTVNINGATYTLNSSPQLTAPSAGVWSLNLSGSPLPTSDKTFVVTATTTDKFGGTISGTATLTNEQFAIATYVAANNLSAVALTNGVKYAVTTAGTGATPATGQTVTATYTAFILNSDGTLGSEVDSNTTGQTFILNSTGGTGGDFVGLNSALLNLKVGSSDTVLIPSSLAYGSAGGTGSTGTLIPANSILVYKLNLISSSTAAAPVVKNVPAATLTPTITGTYDSVNSKTFTVAVNGTTYTLGAANSPLTTSSAGTWTLTVPSGVILASNPTFTVTATSTDNANGTVSDPTTFTNEQYSINKYATANNLTTVPVANAAGVSYSVTTAGTGALPVAGQTVTATFTAFILNADGTLGTEVDSNSTGAKFPLSSGGTTTGDFVGLDAALLNLKVGSSDTVLIPSSLAYGANGGTGSTGTAIPASSILVYKLNIVSASTAAAPTVTNLAAATTTPTITGTYDATNSKTFTVTVNGTTYTLGTSSQLTSSTTAGTWSLNLTGAALPLSTPTFTVTATSTDSHGGTVSGTGTVTNEQSIINTYVTSLNLPSTEPNTVTSSGLNYIVTTPAPSSAPNPKAGQSVTVNYTGYLLNSDGTKGTEFDSNTDPAKGHVQPFAFELGVGSVIPGWDEAFTHLPVGTTATLIIPSALGYMVTGSPPTIPSNAILIFNVTVTGLSNAGIPKVNPVVTPSTTPTITGIYDAANSSTFTVTVNGVTYTLGSSSALTTSSTDAWSLTIPSSAALPVSTTPYTVVATSTDSTGGTVSGFGTVTTQ